MRASESMGYVGWLFGKAMAPQVGRDNARSLVNLENRMASSAA